MRFVVVGAGAIGGTVGAYLARAGEEVLFVDADDAHVSAMSERGLTIVAADGPFTLEVQAARPTEITGRADVVLLAVKAQHTQAAVEPLLMHLAPDGVIVALQNGLSVSTVAELAGPARAIGAYVNFSADYLEPGVIRYYNSGEFYVGELDGSRSERVEEIVRRLSTRDTVHVTENIWGHIWTKLAYVSMLYATAIVDRPQAEVIDRYRPLMASLAGEVFEAALAEGVALAPLAGVEPDLFLPRSGPDWSLLDACFDRIVYESRHFQKPKSGMWRDLAVRRRATEVDAQLGAAVAAGARHGIDMPLNRVLVALVHELENGGRTMSYDNVEELESLRVRSAGEPARPSAAGPGPVGAR
jgi:2-dehydropantoate 2-reductase